ncbi:COMM domain-containing protein 5-like [Daphnia carinata]|uniref:COMM domain-containing protein 5-like n=1 Tax=Daphnia carinata TaxID=120202 RepID=UPI00257982C6|nr:COMM domain-containing protein 5-like [Daphnia carinata]
MSPSSNLLFVLVPKPVEQLSKQLQSKMVDPIVLKTLIDFSIRYWRGEEIHHNEWENVVKESYFPQTLLEELFSGVLNVVFAVLRIPEKLFNSKLVCDELIQLGFTMEQAHHITNLKTTLKPGISCFMKLLGVKWRIDVTISTSNVCRILEPWILMEFNLSSVGLKTIHVPLAQFHSLRYQVALCLTQLDKLSV